MFGQVFENIVWNYSRFFFLCSVKIVIFFSNYDINFDFSRIVSNLFINLLQQKDEKNHSGEAPPNTPSGLFKRNKQQPVDRKRPPTSPSPPPPSSSIHRSTLHSSKSESVQEHPENASFQDDDGVEPDIDHNLHAARAKLRRSNKGIS